MVRSCNVDFVGLLFEKFAEVLVIAVRRPGGKPYYRPSRAGLSAMALAATATSGGTPLGR